jgi:dihydrolipoamide dehydrogenase
VASIGCNEKRAKEARIDYRIQVEHFRDNDRALAEGETKGFIKIVMDSKGKVIGVQIIGPHATEMIHIVSVALKERMTRRKFREVIFAHPTLSEGIRAALER